MLIVVVVVLLRRKENNERIKENNCSNHRGRKLDRVSLHFFLGRLNSQAGLCACGQDHHHFLVLKSRNDTAREEDSGAFLVGESRLQKLTKDGCLSPCVTWSGRGHRVG